MVNSFSFACLENSISPILKDIFAKENSILGWQLFSFLVLFLSFLFSFNTLMYLIMPFFCGKQGFCWKICSKPMGVPLYVTKFPLAALRFSYLECLTIITYLTIDVFWIHLLVGGQGDFLGFLDLNVYFFLPVSLFSHYFFKQFSIPFSASSSESL